MPSRRLKIGAAIAAAGAVSALALAHVPAVRGALLGTSCPFARTPSVAELEGLRAKTAANLRGSASAAARPAFGFALDVTGKDDVLAWGRKAGASCAEEMRGAAIRCLAAAPSDREAVGEKISDAFFRFDPKGRLVAVDVMREGTAPGTAAALFEELRTRTARETGAPGKVVGTASEGGLSASLSRVSAEYRFTDYAAEISATNMGEQGVVVREVYRSLRVDPRG
jgi:hypothetical protein